MVIIDDYFMINIDDWLLLWWFLKKIVISIFSSSINEVISPVLFFYDFTSTKKHQKVLKSIKKHQKALKSIKKNLSGRK